MIRIDLSQDALNKTTPAVGGARILNRLLPKGPKGNSRSLGDPAVVFVFVLSIAAGCLPPLLAQQYERYLTNEREAQIRDFQERLALVNQEIVKLTPYQKELENYDAQKKMVKERLEIIRQLLAARGAPVSILDAVGQSLPQRTWIASLDFSIKGAQGASISPVINMNGMSLSHDEISDFIDKLSESVYFNEVTLDDVGSSRYEGTIDVKTFALIAYPKLHLVNSRPANPPVPPAAKLPGAEEQK